MLNWDGGLELNPPYQVYLGVFDYIASDGLLTPKEIHSYMSYIFQEERSEAVQTKRGGFCDCCENIYTQHYFVTA